MYLPLAVFTQLFSEVARYQPAKPARKQNLTANSPSRSFKVIYFGVIGKAAGDYIILYNNVGLISWGAEDIVSKSHENRRFQLLHCRLTPPLQRTPANIRTNLMSPETRLNGLHFFSLIVWVYLHSFFVVGSERRIFCLTECVSAVQGHPSSLILAPIERAYATSYS